MILEIKPEHIPHYSAMLLFNTKTAQGDSEFLIGKLGLVLVQQI
jgi:hypothetical protein